MDVVKNIGNSVKAGWNNLSKGKKVGLITAIITLLIVVGSLSFMLQKTEYALLFSDIEAADAGNIVNDLEAQNIPYRLEDGGTTIYIDENYVDKYRIELAVNEMLPSQSVGFEIFDNTSMMATDEDREIMRQRAIQGELERAIGALSGVENVKVILSIPQQSIFTRPDELEAATASVMLKTAYGKTLSMQTIQGIASLVSGAVDRLPKENISIVDEDGNLLSAFIQSDTTVQTADLASHNRQIEQNYARELEQKLLKALAPIYGANNLSITVNVKMDFEVAEEEAVVYGDAHIRSQEVTASGGQIGGEDGMTPNDLASNVSVTAEDGNQASYHSTTNNELDSTITRTIKETGEVTNISASILYNTGIPGMNEMDLERVAVSVLGSAAFYDIQVHGANFNTPQTNDFTDPIISGNPFADFWGRYGMMVLAGGGILLFAVILGSVIQTHRRKKRLEMALDQEAWEESTVTQQLEEAKQADSLQELLQNEKLQKELSAMKQAKDNPEVVADLIKMWMKDE